MRLSRIVVSSALLLSFVSGVGAADQKSAAVVPVFAFDRQYTEAPLGDEMLFAASGQETFYQLIQRLKKVRDDEQIKAVVLITDQVMLGRAQLEEVRSVLREIKKSGKEIIAHADSMSTYAYSLAAVADRIHMTPDGDLWLTGMFGVSLHLRGLLDKIDVTPDFLTCGDYKSASEMFMLTEPSTPANDNLNWLFDGIYDAMLAAIAEGRDVDLATVKEWVDHGLYGAELAAEKKIIDVVAYRADLVKYLEDKLGGEIKFDRKYGKKKSSVDLSSPLGIMKFYTDLLTGSRKSKSTKPTIAIVHVEGPILAGKPPSSAFPFGASMGAYSTPIRKAIDEAAADDAIKAVVLRVNSPGGSAVGSEVILAATRRSKAKKPLVVSMGDVAGSGGYYVSCAADTIYVEPSTITASIGVVGGKLATKAMWENIGVTFTNYQRGKNAGLLGSGDPFTSSERAALRAWMDDIYEVFKGHVQSSRGDRLKKDLDELAGGRVFTGQQALELGLVDKIGGLEDAIKHVAAAAGIESYEVRAVPEPKNLAEMMQESFGGSSADEGQLSLESMSNTTLVKRLKPYLEQLDPSRAAALEQAVRHLGILQSERISLHMPAIHIE